MNLEQAILYALDGKAVLFLGSGFSIGATKPNKSEFTIAKPLAHKLLKECGIPDDELFNDLGKASEIYQELKSEHELVDFLREEFTAIGITAAQTLIGSLPWARIYTTNYDNVIELAYQKNKRNLKPAILSQKPIDFKDKKDLCVHLNGRVDGLTLDKLNNEFKLTDKSYLVEDFRKSDWMTLFRTDLLSASAIIFIGYSMQYDLDIQRLFSTLNDVPKKTFFIMRDGESTTSQLLVKKYGTPYAKGLDHFAELVADAKKNHVPTATRLDSYLCFRKQELTKAPYKIVDSDVLKLFTTGEYTSDKLYYSTISPIDYRYCIHRSKLDSTVEDINNGENNILVHSSLGNGKSLFVDVMSSLLTQQGYSVYKYTRYMATFATEVENICRVEGKVAFVFEDYSGCIENLKTLKQLRTDQVLILSERTYVNEANYDTIYNLFGDFKLYDLNVLDDEEVKDLIDLLDTYGFWSYLSARSIIHKQEFIQKTCQGYLRNVILKILQSPDIVDRFKNIVSSIKLKEGYYEAIIFMLVASVSQIKLGLDDIEEALDITKLNSPKFKKNPVVREFVNFDDNTIIPKSSLLSSYILEQIFDTTIVVDTLLVIMQNLNDYGTGKVAKQIMRRLMTFTNVQHILNAKDPNHKHNLLRYYESLKVMPSCSKNPHFWLQYAIVMLSEHNYPQARLYFEAAYSFGEKIAGFDTYQIDNHYARFILENEKISGEQSSCMEAFRNAHTILIDPKHKIEVRYYPYKVARLYYPFYERFYKGMQEYEKKEFVSSCREMLERLEWYERTSEAGSSRKDVIAAKSGIQTILSETSF